MTYKEKANLVMKLNKRMRDIVNKSGFNTAEFSYWQNRISKGAYKSLKTTKAYTADDQQYALLSRKKAVIEKYTEEDLRELESKTRTWKEISAKVQQSMRDQAEKGGVDDAFTGQRRYTNKQINEYLAMRKTINDWFEENADLVYALIEQTGWADIREQSTEEIYKKLTEIREQQVLRGSDYNYTEKDRDRIRAEYRAKRQKMIARRSLRR